MSFTFVLNNLPQSTLMTNDGWFTAFSGHGAARNNSNAAALANGGPIPPGSYFIVDRKSGGKLGALRDWLLNRDKWFALYRDDGSIDDQTFVDGVSRGLFRLHPLGPRRMSTGCIVLQYPSEFDRLRARLLDRPVEYIPNSGLRSYGKVDVAIIAPDMPRTQRQRFA